MHDLPPRANDLGAACGLGAAAVVLVGAGHAHVEVLRRLGLRPIAGVRLTLITPAARTAYSGMLPGLVAGRFPAEAAHIDVARLARFAGARLVLDDAIGLDLERRRVLCRHAGAVPYDVVSLDVGSGPNTGGAPGADAHAIPVRPIGGFLERFDALRARVAAGASRRIVMVGGGAGGVELLLSVERRLRAPGVSFALVASSAEILPGLPPGARARFRAVLAARGIEVHAGARAARVAAGHLEAGGVTIAADEVLWATGAAAAAWLAGTGLAVDGAGFVRVDGFLRAAGRREVFAAGDMAAFHKEAGDMQAGDMQAVPRSGVYAVRAGPVLAGNIRAAVLGRPLRAYRPQRAALQIVSTGGDEAVLTRGGLVAEGRWVLRLKDWIDGRFMDRFASLPADRTVNE